MAKIPSYHKRLDQYRTSSLKLADRLSDSIAAWCGSWSFFVCHALWFAFWLILRLDIGTLTLIGSLEAIILMSVLLMYQKRQAKKDDLRDEADYQADKHSETAIEELKEMVKEIKEKLK